ncbi:MAG: hypothetical protein EB127_10165 [Alphaproteobacteria bacterium]|nr:hypothetical protein [Alphaproteobacteria bacterium]
MNKFLFDSKNVAIGFIFGVAIGAITFTGISWAQESTPVRNSNNASPTPISLSPNTNSHSNGRLDSIPSDLKPYGGRRLFRIGNCEAWTAKLNDKDFVFSVCPNN